MNFNVVGVDSNPSTRTRHNTFVGGWSTQWCWKFWFFDFSFVCLLSGRAFEFFAYRGVFLYFCLFSIDNSPFLSFVAILLAGLMSWIMREVVALHLYPMLTLERCVRLHLDPPSLFLPHTSRLSLQFSFSYYVVYSSKKTYCCILSPGTFDARFWLYGPARLIVHFVLRCFGSSCTLNLAFFIFSVLVLSLPRDVSLRLGIVFFVLFSALVIAFVPQGGTRWAGSHSWQ